MSLPRSQPPLLPRPPRSRHPRPRRPRLQTNTSVYGLSCASTLVMPVSVEHANLTVCSWCMPRWSRAQPAWALWSASGRPRQGDMPSALLSVKCSSLSQASLSCVVAFRAFLRAHRLVLVLFLRSLHWLTRSQTGPDHQARQGWRPGQRGGVAGE
jgi:hypothetical protein